MTKKTKKTEKSIKKIFMVQLKILLREQKLVGANEKDTQKKKFNECVNIKTHIWVQEDRLEN